MLCLITSSDQGQNRKKIIKLRKLKNPIPLASILSKELERILFEYRLLEYTITTDNQLGFNKHGTDVCVYALNEVLSKYRRHDFTVFMCVLYASKAFDRIN